MGNIKNLKNQKKAVEETTETVELGNELSEPTPTVEKFTGETEEETTTEEDKKIYFINSKTLNLSTMVGKFRDGVFVTTTAKDAEIVRRTEDFQRGFVKELTEEEFLSQK
jgi:hypothetical protein